MSLVETFFSFSKEFKKIQTFNSMRLFNKNYFFWWNYQCFEFRSYKRKTHPQIKLKRSFGVIFTTNFPIFQSKQLSQKLIACGRLTYFCLICNSICNQICSVFIKKCQWKFWNLYCMRNNIHSRRFSQSFHPLMDTEEYLENFYLM